MRLADFKLIDYTQGALTWRIVERIQTTLDSVSEISMKYFSSVIVKRPSHSIVVNINIPDREIIINLRK